MSSAFQHPVFDEPDAAEPGAKPKRFKVAPTFVIDLSFSVLCLAGIAPVWRAALGAHGAIVAVPTFALLILILACYFGKTLTVGHLDGKGGDARTYVKSGALVQTGPYAWSRHPTYALAMLQFLLWSALGLYVQAFAPFSPFLWLAAIGAPLGFYLINDLVVMPTEEAMLRRLHPDAFDAYAAKVNRWFGRRAG
jgi:protein-S-isoprenylcysteine O-methyltransferase Ste14